MIGNLLYLIASHPDITFLIGMYGCYLAKPKVIHVTQVKRIIKYINGISDYDILYSHDTMPFYLDIMMLIGLGILKIERAPLVDASSYETI